MKTIALRFSDNIAPKDGTISEHRKIIDHIGYVWYGKFGAKVSETVRNMIMSSENKRILLIHSGTIKRYWLYIDAISYTCPERNAIPEYYREIAESVKTWFKVIQIEDADRKVMAKCTVSSSGSPLSAVSRHSMSPYFIIDYDERT